MPSVCSCARDGICPTGFASAAAKRETMRNVAHRTDPHMRIARLFMPRRVLVILLAVMPLACRAGAEPELRNWFNDPFFQVSSAIEDCPLPAGPFTSEAERRADAHRRAEKGTTCWLAGQCERPSAYAYDEDIAAAIRSSMRDSDNTSLWVTVQGRVVYIDGCAASVSQVEHLVELVRNVPHVQQVITSIRTDATRRPPYRTRTAR